MVTNSLRDGNQPYSHPPVEPLSPLSVTSELANTEPQKTLITTLITIKHIPNFFTKIKPH